MTNYIPGLLTVLCCAVGYFYSWKYQSKENFVVAISLLMLCGLALRIYASCDFFLHPWDERYHALVAKNLLKHPLIPTLYDHPVLRYDYTNWSANHIWLHKPPLPLWLMAASMWLFGINEIALRLPSVIATTIGIYLTFYIGNYFFNKKTGYFAAFLYSISGVIIEMTGGRIATDHYDALFLFFIELALFFSILFIKRKNTLYTIIAGVCIGVAILTKWLPALIAIAVWILLVIDSKKIKPLQLISQLLIFAIACCAIVVPWQVYIYNTFPAEAHREALNNLQHITQTLDNQGGQWYYYLLRIGINYGELIYLPLLWFLYKWFINPCDLKRLAIIIWFVIPLIFFSFVKTKMEGYILFTCPALFIMTADFWVELISYKVPVNLKWLKIIVLVLLVGLPVRYCIERLKVFENRDRNSQWMADLKTLRKTNYKNGVLFNYNRSIEAMFYTNLTVYPNVPPKDSVVYLIQKGYTVIINDDGTVNKDILSVNGVITSHLQQPLKN